ncbi:DUF7544 domain-containing protein [Halorhabdus rudnickae]|uniref:DUF7544 domain-containing protein n=1 Tax=Halorhabdus rudnickae TaxID=1775544 RepID=UPI0010829599|nr:hypothetical protein [Halorhabdus rudnickae]
MALYAVERIDDAVDMTRSFLSPVEAGRWGRLAVVVAFLLGGTGGGGGAASTVTNTPTTAGSIPENGLPELSAEFPELTGTAVAVVIGVIALLVLGGLVVAAIGAVMEFVFVQSLSADEVHVRQYVRRYAGKGVRLFGFRIVLGLGTLAVLGGATVLLFGDVFAGLLAGEVGVPSASRLVVGAILLVPLGIAVGVLVALANGFTTEFVVPIMLREDRGVLAGWRRFWPTLVDQWKQYGTYVLVAFGLHIVTEIAGTIVLGIAAVALAIPFLIVAVPVGFGMIGSGTITAGAVVLLVALLAAYLLVLFVAAAVIYVPIKVFHRQYALLVLGDTNTNFDVLGDRRPSQSL